MHTYPVNLIDLSARKTVVIGGGTVALRKVEGLLEADAQVAVISPALADGLAVLHAAGKIAVIQRPYQDGDLADAWLVIAATDDPAVNHAVFAEASAAAAWSTWWTTPSTATSSSRPWCAAGKLTLAISTGGASPALARRLRERLAEIIGPEYGDLAALLAELRPALLAGFPPGQPRLDAALRLVDSDLLAVVKAQGMAAARAYAQALLETLRHGNQTEHQSRTIRDRGFSRSPSRPGETG